MKNSMIRFLDEGPSEGFYELETGGELGFLWMIFLLVAGAALIAVLVMAGKAWRRQRLTDPRKDHYRR